MARGATTAPDAAEGTTDDVMHRPLPPQRELAPMPGAAEIDDEDDGPTMEQWLLRAGAKRDGRGRWYREVPSNKPKRVIVEDGHVWLETDYVRRWVAVAEDPIEAVKKARAANGTHDAFVPGVGWVRNGWKPEKEHPTNVGTEIHGASRVEREAIPIDTAEAQKALALTGALKAARDQAREED